MHFTPRQALRSVLPDAEQLSDEDLGLLFMKIDANGSGDIDWDEFTGFLLQAREVPTNWALLTVAVVSQTSLRPPAEEVQFLLISNSTRDPKGIWGGGRLAVAWSHLVFDETS